MANEEVKVTVRPVNTIQFDKDNDGELMQHVNNYASVFNEKVMKKTPPRNVIRNFLIEELPKAIKRLMDGNGEKASQG